MLQTLTFGYDPFGNMTSRQLDPADPKPDVPGLEFSGRSYDDGNYVTDTGFLILPLRNGWGEWFETVAILDYRERFSGNSHVPLFNLWSVQMICKSHRTMGHARAPRKRSHGSWRCSLLLLFLFLASNAGLVGCQGLSAAFATETSEEEPQATRASDATSLYKEALQILYLAPSATAKEKASARKQMKRAAEMGYVPAMVRYGEILVWGIAGPRDADEGRRWLHQALEKGELGAAVVLANLYNLGLGVPRDYVRGIQFLRMAAEGGRQDAQRLLGNALEAGHGAPKDFEKAEQWYRRAAEAGDAGAKWELGRLLEKEAAGGQLPEEAVKWYASAAEAGIAPALLRMGDLYAAGTGVGQDLRRAVDFYRRAIGMANNARFNLAKVYEHGIDGKPDLQQAFEFYLLAAGCDTYAPARQAVARMLSKGLGCSKDPVRAYAWLLLNERDRGWDGGELKRKLESTLSDRDRSDAEALAAKWLKNGWDGECP